MSHNGGSGDRPDFVRRELEAGVLLAGNHLASALSGQGVQPATLRESNYEAVQTAHGLLVADIWICWKAIMDWRDYTESPDPPARPLEQMADVLRQKAEAERAGRRVDNPPHGPVSERIMRHSYGAKK